MVSASGTSNFLQDMFLIGFVFFFGSLGIITKWTRQYRDFPYILCFYTCTASHTIKFPYQTQTFDTIHEPTLAFHHPKSIVYIRAYSCHCTSCKFHQMYNDLCLPLHHHIEYSQFPKSTLCFTSSLLLFPLPLATSDGFPVSIIFPFPPCHVVGSYNIQIFPLNTMHKKNSSLSFVAWWLIYFYC